VLYATLKDGDPFEVLTYPTHPWVITDGSDRARDVYYPTRESRTVTITGPPQK
jgi:hypothetical protein